MSDSQVTASNDSGFFNQLGDVFINGLNRSVDNATTRASPNPNTQTGSSRIVVGTNNNGTGITKNAGTGNSFLPNVSNTMLAVGVGSVILLTLFLVLKK